jgi:single-stranded-DNA-specific exonuclease
VKEWIEPQDVQIPEALRAAVGGHLLVARTLVRRGFAQVEAARAFLDPNRYRPAPSTDLPNMVAAAERLERAIQAGETICVWGDFDVDGQTATTLLLSTLQELVSRQGASPESTVRYHIPHRQRESHGISLPVLKQLVDEGVDLVLTCDTGVTAHEPIAYAQAHGVDVIVTDHHDLPPTLPTAHSVVNPKMLPEDHPLRHLPGVGCAYKLAEALYERAGRPQDSARYLDLVALGIVADVAVQTGDTRYLLQRGLEALRQTERLGLRVVMEVAELTPEWLTEEHIGFVLGPRLNALGRLADASVAVELLTTQDLARARILATELEGLNAQRKLLGDQVTQAAQAQIERDPSLLDYGALVLSHPTWPAGVIGIVAGRLAERYGRPTILIATPPGELGRGSARSVPGCNISAAIAAQARLLASFGGHPMAAGLAIDPDRIPEFRRALSRTVLEMVGGPGGFDELSGSRQIDAYLSLADLSLDLVAELERLAPFGLGNPPLTLATKGLSLKSHTPVGRGGEHLQLIVEDGEGTTQNVIWWQGAGSSLPEGRFDLAYVVRASDFRGERTVQVEWVEARPIKAPALGPVKGPGLERPAVDVVDYRSVSNPHQVLQRLRARENVLVWSEAGHRSEVEGRDRYELIATGSVELGPAQALRQRTAGPRSGQALAIWTTPPGPNELRAVLEEVSPGKVYLFGIDPGLDRVQEFLKRLAGLVKRALNSSEGRVHLSTLAAGTAQRESTVRAGLEWLAARGHIVVVEEKEQESLLSAGSGMVSDDLPRIVAQLQAALEETTAYRAYFDRADPQALA